MNDWELLQEFLRSRSEQAFRQIVERHGGMVLASAIRQLGDEHAAQDVTQAVFILLARKAARISRGTVLAGWLFQTTRFVAARALRSERRRQQREQEAFDMQQLTSGDDTWRHIAPIIDEALATLGAADRDVILLRYMQGRSMRELANALGVNEEAAKKRVTRAVERLRSVIAKRGVAASALAITAGLAANASAAPSAGWAAGISTACVAETAAGASAAALVAEVVSAWRWARMRWIACAAALLVATAVVLSERSGDGSGLPSSGEQAEAAKVENSPPPSISRDVAAPTGTVAADGMKEVRILVTAADTGEPIQNAQLSLSAWTPRNIDARSDLWTDSAGVCLVPYPADSGRIDVGVLTKGWAARYATWPSEGLPDFPPEYTFRLARVTNTIGGRLSDAAGLPVAGAEILFAGHESGDSAHRERPRERFGFLNEITATRTDAGGRWTISSIPVRHPGFRLAARHADFANTQIAYSPQQDNALETEDSALRLLWRGSLVSTMHVAFTLTGTVQDERGTPIASAVVQRNASGPSFRSGADGQFKVQQLKEGEWPFTVAAEGFAPLRTNAMVGASMEPMVITLRTGAVLRVRVLDEHGMEVPDAEVGMEQWGINRHDIEWRGRTDANGFLEWRSAPHDAVMELFARKDGYCYTRDVKLKADGQVHVIRLRHALMLFGRVVDAGTGALIPDFRAVPAYGGYGDRAERWFAGSTVRGTNGLFRLAFDDRDGPWHVRIIADGYEDWTSEPLEGEALTLDIPLKKALKDNSLRGIVLAPDGRPAAAQVALLTFEHNVSLTQKGRFEPRNKRWLTDSAADGSFSFPTNSMAHSLAVATAEGFALLRLAGAKPPVTIQLQPWGRVEGVVHPSAAAQGIDKIELFDPTAQNYQGHVSLLSHFSVRPDAAGRFAFERVPAGEFSAYVNSGSDINFHHQTPCAVRPGETTTVIITNGPGALVKGRLIAPLNRAFSWKDDCTLIHLYAEGRNLEFPPGTAADRRMREFEFWTSTAGRDYVNNTHVYSGRVSNEGTFVMLDPVRPGKYRFTAIFSPSGIPNLSITRHVTIPDQAVFDLGDLPLE